VDSDFWKQFPDMPGFDCIKMKRDIQTKIHQETKGMTQEERLEYYRQGALRFRQQFKAKAHEKKTAAVREENAPYGKKPAGKKK